ncbi:MAG TPA: DUF4249 domain-containing protein [Salinimicrobium sp.]|nr:DUF4249 domain-containing protein [Salinimicrobium sp.]
MIQKIKNSFFLLLITNLLVLGCVEPYDFATETFEQLLVVEANITNENKQQEVFLSRTIPLGETEEAPERQAKVWIEGDDGSVYDFSENEPGHYISVSEFAAATGVSYQLVIITSEGETFSSEPTKMVINPGLDNLYAAKTINDEGDEGFSFMIDNSGTAETTDYFKYEYVETYKIVPPHKTFQDLIVVDGEPVLVPKIKEAELCFNSEASSEIILASTNSLAVNALEAFQVRFLSKHNPKVSQRYSLLVKQYALTQEAYSYYATLQKFSGSESLFSQTQPGFINGNLFSVDNPDEKVVGYFNVASVVSKRVFVNFLDYFNNEDRQYFMDCSITRPEFAITAITLIQEGLAKFISLSLSPPDHEGKGPIRIAPAPCVDCTLLGSPVPPDFWVEDDEVAEETE